MRVIQGSPSKLRDWIARHASENGYLIVCNAEFEVTRMQATAEQAGVSIKHPITIDGFLYGEAGETPVIIEDVASFIRSFGKVAIACLIQRK